MVVEEFLKVAQPILDERHLYLVDLKISKSNDIELLVDALTGVNISTCIEVSREIESHFDREKEDFSLTVASAGIGYPFKVPQQFEKNIGRTVEIKFNDNKKIEALLLAYHTDSIEIEFEEKVLIEGKKRKQLVTRQETIELSNVKEIKDVVTF